MKTTSWWHREETNPVNELDAREPASRVRPARELVLDDLDGLPSAFNRSARSTSAYEMPGLGWRYG